MRKGNRERLRRAFSIQQTAVNNCVQQSAFSSQQKKRKKQILRYTTTACGVFSGKEIHFSLPDTLTDDKQDSYTVHSASSYRQSAKEKKKADQPLTLEDDKPKE